MSGFLEELDESDRRELRALRAQQYRPPRSFLDEIDDSLGTDEEETDEQRMARDDQGLAHAREPGAGPADGVHPAEAAGAAASADPAAGRRVGAETMGDGKGHGGAKPKNTFLEEFDEECRKDELATLMATRGRRFKFALRITPEELRGRHSGPTQAAAPSDEFLSPMEARRILRERGILPAPEDPEFEREVDYAFGLFTDEAGIMHFWLLVKHLDGLMRTRGCEFN